MRALSLGLIKGKINEVTQTVNVTWVQPKVLDMEQIKAMQNSIDQWSQKYALTDKV